MRIRNSRPCFPHLYPTAVNISRSSYRQAQSSLLFDERFLVEETNRQILWSYCSSRKPSSEIDVSQLGHNFQPTISCATKSSNHTELGNGKENCMQEIPICVSKKLGETSNEGRRTSWSKTFEREGDRSKIARSIVLALPASSVQPEVGIPCKKKRMYRQSEIKENEARMEQEKATAELMRDSVIVPEKEAANKTDDNERANGIINCVLNTEASPPSPTFDNPRGEWRNEVVFSLETTIMPEGTQKRRRGRPRKIDQQTMGTIGL